jgi:hypothetical protein
VRANRQRRVGISDGAVCENEPGLPLPPACAERAEASLRIQISALKLHLLCHSRNDWQCSACFQEISRVSGLISGLAQNSIFALKLDLLCHSRNDWQSSTCFHKISRLSGADLRSRSEI